MFVCLSANWGTIRSSRSYWVTRALSSTFSSFICHLASRTYHMLIPGCPATFSVTTNGPRREVVQDGRLHGTVTFSRCCGRLRRSRTAAPVLESERTYGAEAWPRSKQLWEETDAMLCTVRTRRKHAQSRSVMRPVILSIPTPGRETQKSETVSGRLYRLLVEAELESPLFCRRDASVWTVGSVMSRKSYIALLRSRLYVRVGREHSGGILREPGLPGNYRPRTE